MNYETMRFDVTVVDSSYHDAENDYLYQGKV